MKIGVIAPTWLGAIAANTAFPERPSHFLLRLRYFSKTRPVFAPGEGVRSVVGLTFGGGCWGAKRHRCIRQSWFGGFACYPGEHLGARRDGSMWWDARTVANPFRAIGGILGVR